MPKKKDSHEIEAPKQELVAKKDWLIVQNEFRRQIKAGDDLSDLPERFIAAMKTEGVI